jgi:hypothetical protein
VSGGAPGADPGVEVRAAARLELVRLADEGKLTLKTVPYPLSDVRPHIGRASRDTRRGSWCWTVGTDSMAADDGRQQLLGGAPSLLVGTSGGVKQPVGKQV